MPRKFKIAFYILFLIIFLPTLIFSVFEMGNYSHYEKKIEEVIEKSLGTALYSLNLFTNDIINEWNRTISGELVNHNGKPDKNSGNLSQLPAIRYFFASENGKIQQTNSKIEKSEITEIEKILRDNESTIQKLKKYYKENDYKKPESFTMNNSDDILILFVCDLDGKLNVCGYVFDPKIFINDILGPKTQQTAGQDFNIFIFQKGNDTPVYVSDIHEEIAKKTSTEKIWLLPGFSSGISLKSSTISDIVKPRTQKFLYLGTSVTLALLLGVFMIFRTMRNQIELAQLKSEFISNVSHEIRTPLALIQMYVETLDMDRVKKEEKKKEYYNIILQETIRLSGIVNKILNFTRIEKGKREYQFSDTDVNAVVESIMSTYHFHLENRGFEYKTELSSDLPLIFADKEAISDSVINLIDNAVKYSGENKAITIKTGRLNDKIFIEVRDRGIGISEKDQKNIFDKFYRVTSGDLAYKAKGTGLGLTIVKHVMDAHHGEISLKSKQGEGSAFRLIFPQEGIMY